MGCENKDCQVIATVPLNASSSALKEAQALLEQTLGPGKMVRNGHVAEFVVICNKCDRCVKALSADVNTRTLGEMDGEVGFSQECPEEVRVKLQEDLITVMSLIY